MVQEVEGLVEKGLGLSSETHGYPSANIKSDLEMGIYTGSTKYGPCILAVGTPPSTEIHIFEFDGDLYGKNLKIKNIKRVPEELTFAMYKINKEKYDE
tara:strand:- start:39 stop:332 length:294 start_codon:yes stop_codon:yes gene_type:complete